MIYIAICIVIINIIDIIIDIIITFIDLPPGKCEMYRWQCAEEKGAISD